MVKKLKIFSLILVYSGVCSLFYMHFSNVKDEQIQDSIISDVFNTEDGSSSDYVFNDYLGYLYIPKYDVRRIIEIGTDSSVLDSGFVGMHRLSGCLSCNDLIILAGHNIPNVFSKLHNMDVGDVVYINSYNLSRKFIVYDKKKVNEYDFSYLINNRKNELLLITCTMNKGERLLVFLKEDL